MDPNSPTTPTETNMSGSEHSALEGFGNETTKLLIDEMHISAGTAFSGLAALVRMKNEKTIPDPFSASEDKWTEFKKIIDPLHKERVVKQDGSTISCDPKGWMTFATVCASLWLIGANEEEVEHYQVKMDHLYRLQGIIESGEKEEEAHEIKQQFERVARDVMPAFLAFINARSGKSFIDALQTDVTKESAEYVDEDEDEDDGTPTHLDEPPAPAPAPPPAPPPAPEEDPEPEEKEEEGAGMASDTIADEEVDTSTHLEDPLATAPPPEEGQKEDLELEPEPESAEDAGNTGGDSVEERLPNFTQHMINMLRGADLLEGIEDEVAYGAVSQSLDGIIDLVRIETTEMNKVELVEQLTQQITEQVRVEVEEEFTVSQREQISARVSREEEYEQEKSQLKEDAETLRESVESLEKQVEAMEERNRMWERNFEKAAKAYFDPDAEGSSSAMVSAPSSPPDSANGSPSDTRPDASLAAAAAAPPNELSLPPAAADELSLPPAAADELSLPPAAATESAAPVSVKSELQPNRTRSSASVRTNQSGRSTLTSKDLDLEGEKAQQLWDKQLRLPKGEDGTDESSAFSLPPPSYRQAACDADLGAEEESPTRGMQRAVGGMHSAIELMTSSFEKVVSQKGQANLEAVAAHTENKQLRQKVQDLEERLQAKEQEQEQMQKQEQMQEQMQKQMQELKDMMLAQRESQPSAPAPAPAPAPWQLTDELREVIDQAAIKACLLSSQKMAKARADAAQRAADVEFQVRDLWAQIKAEAQVEAGQMLETEEDGQEATQGVLSLTEHSEH